VYNQVYHLQKPDYSKDVTEASNKAYIFVLLTSSQGTNVESRILIEIWRELAQRFGDVKFCQIRADLCIEGYPDKNTPTILVYKDGDIKKQVVTLRELRGTQTKTPGELLLLLQMYLANGMKRGLDLWLLMKHHVELAAIHCPIISEIISYSSMLYTLLTFLDLEKILTDVGAVRPTDQRLRRRDENEETRSSTIRQSKTVREDDDSDWD
jgi:hypothetical protein